MKKAIYTFIFGDYDTLKEPLVVTPGWDYICFSDHSPPEWFPQSVWQIREPVLPKKEDPKKWAIGHMIMAHKVLPEYDLTLSVGAQIEINCHLDAFVAKRFREDTPLMLIRHSERACVYDEAEACKALKKDHPGRIDAYVERLREFWAMPPSFGLFATGVMGRRHGSQRLAAMCEDWHDEMLNHSKRDQLSLPPMLRLYHLPISELGWHQTFGSPNPPFLLHRHRQ